MWVGGFDLALVLTRERDFGFFVADDGVPGPERRFFLSISIFSQAAAVNGDGAEGTISIKYEEDVVISRNNQCVHPIAIF